MKHWVMLLAAFVLLSAHAQQVVLPADVMRFTEGRDQCDHFRGEEPYDAERRKFLKERMRSLCTGTDAQLKALKSKYKGKPKVLAKLAEYEPQIEAVGK
jgi:hypothetical protein